MRQGTPLLKWVHPRMTAMAKHASVRVEGNSMAPTYYDGEWLMARWADYSMARNPLTKLLHRLRLLNFLAVGDTVVIERAEQPGIYFVKRIADAREQNAERPMIYLLSDNPAGTDSRTWGWLPIHYVKARIEFRVKRAKPTSL
ncbi:MAG: S26 family signal peptidase [Candidatus Planktophila sp.]|nr:S26 family signal peptidase [Candidatus Planktophila sp.]MSO24841.1 S26 family signal peptidase [Candidatus Planktophila sp.]